ncbi:MAG: hypothetical protein HWE22_18060 [Flavobacteriales bacterium]|nr:hypothetical protein [Flavobacteriales bacterium]
MKMNIKGVVRGVSRNKGLKTFERFTIRVWRKPLQTNRSLIKEVLIEPDGSFSTRIESELDSNFTIWLELYKLHERKEEILVAQSGPYCPKEEFHVTFQYNSKDFIVEFDHIDQELKSLLGREKPQNLTQKDIQELTCLSCVDINDIRKWMNAYRFSDEIEELLHSCSLKTSLSDANLKENVSILKESQKPSLAPIFYPFVDSTFNQEINLARILTRSENQFKEELARAVENKEIEFSEEDIQSASAGLTHLRDCLLFNSEYDGLNHDAKLIHLSSLDFYAKNQLLNQVLDAGGLSVLLDEQENSGPILKLLALENKKVSKKRSFLAREELMGIMEWDRYTKSFTPLLARIVPNLMESNWNKTTLISYSQEEWLNEINSLEGSIRYPTEYDDLEDPVQAFASDLVRTLSNQFPTEKLVTQIDQSELPYKRDFKRVLRRNPDFDIQNQAVSRHFSINPEDRAPEKISEKDYKHLQELQRSIKLSGGVENLHHAAALLKEDLTSGMKIVRLGKFEFARKMRKHDFQDWEIKGIWCRAEAYYHTSKDIVLNYVKYEKRDALLPLALRNENRTSAISTDLNLPNMETLFGSLDRCSCKHCQSVYSPAAYLTDMLQWLKSDVVCQQTNENGFTELDRRRPDIKYIQLNCKNTNTVLPYIDLVNEVLLTHLEGNVPNESQLRDLQTTWDSDKLIMEPDHINHLAFDGAKDKLREVKYPWTLPYDRDADLAQSYLEELSISYPDLVNDFSLIGQEFDTKFWANARLNLLSYLDNGTIKFPNWNVLTISHSGANFWKDYYGLVNEPDYVAEVLKSTKVSLKVLKELLEVKFILQSDSVSVIEDSNYPCDVSKMSITGFGDVADRLMRFELLRTKTGLEIGVLDQAIEYLGGGDLNTSFLIKLAGLIELSNRTQVDSSALITLWNNSLETEKRALLSRLSGFDESNTNKLVDELFAPISSELDTPKKVLEFLILCDKIKKLNVSPEELISMIQFNNSWGIDITSAPVSLGSSISDPIISGWNAMCENLKSLINGFVLQHQSIIDLKDSIDETQVDIDALNALTSLSPEQQEELDGLTSTKNELTLQLSTREDQYLNDLKSVVGLSVSNELQLSQAIIDTIVPSSDFTSWVQNFVNPELWVDWNNPVNSSSEVFAVFYRSLLRVTIIKDKLGMNDAFLESVLSQTSSLNTSNFEWISTSFANTLPATLHKIFWCKEFTDQVASIGISIEDYYDQVLAIDVNPISDLTSANTRASEFYSLLSNGWNEVITEDQFKELFAKAFSVTRENDLVKILRKAVHIFEYHRTLSASINEVWKLVWLDAPFTGSHSENSIAENVDLLAGRLEALNSENDWIKMNTSVHNRVRVNLRNALVNYYISNEVGGETFINENAIYAYFLLDPEMEACMKTSRTKLAISGMQMLMHRAMIGLEQHLCPTEDNKLEWEWRKNYRVWEANRKVFLYPENWIDPTLRLDKSEFFEELEDSLLQDEINDENAEKAMQRYLSNLNRVARLDIRGMYVETEEDNVEDTIHVFGSTFDTPREYFYRRREPDNYWTPWEKLELDIEGEHIIPVFQNRRLHVYWPIFIPQEHRKIKTIIDGEEQNAPYYEIKLCFSKLEFGQWSPKKIIDKSVFAGRLTGPGVFNSVERKLGHGFGLSWQTYNGGTVNGFYEENGVLFTHASMDMKKFYFWPEKLTDGGLIIHVARGRHEGWDQYSLGYSDYNEEDSFLIHSCTGASELIPPKVYPQGEQDRFLARPHNTIPHNMQFKIGYDRPDGGHGVGRGVHVKHQKVKNGGYYQILRRHTDDSFITYSAQNQHAIWDSPFFLVDSKHTLFFNREVEKKCSLIRTSRNGYYLPYHYEQQKNKYIVQAHEHPYACLMLAEFNQFGIKGLLASKNQNFQLRRQQQIVNYFRNEYQPVGGYIERPYPIDEFDFNYFGAYQKYNWEIFFHAPSLIARQLKSNAQFADAINWISFIFDPTNRDVHLQDQRFWMLKPFVKDVSQDSIQSLLHLLGATGLNSEQARKRAELKAQIEKWRNDPFNPHGIAEMRHRAYMLWTVCEYVDILIEWGDSLFRQDSIESINEASNLYVLAAEILGNRPQVIEKPSGTITDSFADLGAVDAFSNAVLNVENEIPGVDPMICCQDSSSERYQLPDLLFCIPDNPKLQELWDRTEDRLFKIRHCMNIDGQVRELPLFQPPIDPALLVRARAMGIDIGEVLQDLAQPSPHYRYGHLLQKANEFTSEVKALGAALLSALEKKDAEELSQLRQLHEQNILKATRNLKKMSIEEAKLGLESAKHSKKLIEIRLEEYEGREFMNESEIAAQKQTKTSEIYMYIEQALSGVSGLMVAVPDLFLAAPTAAGSKVTGGDKFYKALQSGALTAGVLGSISRNRASLSSTTASYEWREKEWNFQIKIAKEELKQVEKTILSAELRIAIAEKDLENHELQIEQSKEMFDFVKSKFTNLKLYSWMSGELMKLHYRGYKLAYEMAKQAQRAASKELNVDLSVIDFGHFDSSQKGLLAGERLSMQLKELDNAYIKHDTRKFELSKDISLKLLDPGALVNLTHHKYCKFELETELLQMIFQSRNTGNIRIKSLGISIPCVTGPYVSTNVKLRVEGGEEFITSTGVNDMGVFEPNFSQAKYMPFEYLELKNNQTWELMLDENSEFDLTTMSDVILHVRYYAENDSATIETINEVNTPSSQTHLLMSWKHDFPLEWQRYIDDANNNVITSDYPSLDSHQIPYKLRGSIDVNSAFVEKAFVRQGEDLVESTLTQHTSNMDDVWLLYTSSS